MKTHQVIWISSVILQVACATRALAQAAAASQPAALPSPTETMVVLGSPVPTPLAESPASVQVLPAAGQTLVLQSEQDLLRQDSSVFLEQRGAGGGQADIV